MIDIKWIRNNVDILSESLKRRGAEDVSEKIIDLDEVKRDLVTKIQDLRTKKNLLDQEIKNNSGDRDALIKEAVLIKKEEEAFNTVLHETSCKLDEILAVVPNILDESVPYGTKEEDSIEIRRHGTTNHESWMKEHPEAAHGYIDIARAVKMSGSRFVILRSDIARLERALGNWMLDVHTTEFGFEEFSVPYILTREALFGSAHLPKFEQDLFKTCHDKFLISTSEAPLANMFREEIIKENSLPIRLAAYTPCFRSECGSSGKDTHGMIRVHQFNKVELVSICHPDKSKEEHEFITSCAEEILKRLGLSYRVAVLCSCDTGATSSKTYDLEVWMPGQNKYREISSCSNCLCYQSRRMNTRFKSAQGETIFPHTLNGSGVAVGRALVAIIENFQKENGDIAIPKVLMPYMNGKEIIKSYET